MLPRPYSFHRSEFRGKYDARPVAHSPTPRPLLMRRMFGFRPYASESRIVAGKRVRGFICTRRAALSESVTQIFVDEAGHCVDTVYGISPFV